MSTHTPKTQQVVALPCEQRVQTAIDTLNSLESNLRFVKFTLKQLNAEANSITAKLNKLRLVLEAK